MAVGCVAIQKLYCSRWARKGLEAGVYRNTLHCIVTRRCIAVGWGCNATRLVAEEVYRNTQWCIVTERLEWLGLCIAIHKLYCD